MLLFLQQIDNEIFRFINQSLSYPWLDQITPIITDLHFLNWFKIPAVLLIIGLFIKKYKRQGITYFLFLLLSLSLSDFIGGRVKKVVQRPRPFQVEELHTIQKSPGGENKSFYSNHSSNMFTLATYVSAFFPGGKILLFCLASLIAFTRVHVGVHYPSDVLAGALIGIVIGYILSSFVKNKIPFNSNKKISVTNND